MLLQNKYIVHLLMLFGVIALLSVVTVSSYTLAVIVWSRVIITDKSYG